jgi:hypothetical protein
MTMRRLREGRRAAELPPMRLPRFSRTTSALLGVAALSTTATAVLLGPGAILLALVWLLVLAAWFDNHTGSCLMVALLFVIVVATLAFLVGLAALPR